MKLVKSDPVVVCPNRLYANDYQILREIAIASFGQSIRLVTAIEAQRAIPAGTETVVVFGKRWGKELKLPTRGGHGGYFVDWVLAHLNAQGELDGFVAIEVQSMDTTGNYRAEREAYLKGEPFDSFSVAGINWENVSKRILPQIIYKGNVLRRERLCTRGLFFVCPTPVYQRVNMRLGEGMLEYQNLQPGSLTFRWYDVDYSAPPGSLKPLIFAGQFSTTVDQVALAFTSPTNLPPPNVYENAIRAELS